MVLVSKVCNTCHNARCASWFIVNMKYSDTCHECAIIRLERVLWQINNGHIVYIDDRYIQTTMEMYYNPI